MQLIVHFFAQDKEFDSSLVVSTLDGQDSAACSGGQQEFSAADLVYL